MSVQTLEQLLDELEDKFSSFDFDLSAVASWMRYAYGHAYVLALEADSADSKQAREFEREAWARLP